MRDEIPTLTADERALLQRFRVDESPAPAVQARVLRGLSTRLGDEVAPTHDRPWWLWLRAGALSVGIAACGLLVLGGTARLVAPAARPAPTEAMDVATPTIDTRPIDTPAPTPSSTAPARDVVPSEIDATPIEPIPTPVIAAPNVDDNRSRARTSKRNADVAPAAAPIDAAAEIALLGSIKTERNATARLAAIATYRRDFAKGSFAQEVAVLEIEALCELGRTHDATERGEAFVRRFGDSAYAAIARRGCAEAKP